MKTNHNILKGLKNRKNIYKYMFAFIFTFILVLTVPGSFNKVYAAPLEDCDLDGYDDATGVPVPWPGYDETKGDTPDGPAGSKVTTPTTVPTTAEGSKDNVTPSKSSSSDTDKTDSTNGNTNNGSSTKSSTSNSSKTNSSTKDNSAGTETTKTSSTDSSNTKSSVTDKSSKSEADKSSSTVKNNTTKTESNKDSNTTSANTSNSNSTTDDGGNKTDASLNTTSNVSGDSNTENTTVATEENSQAETSQVEDQQADVSSDNGEVEAVDITNINTDGIVDDYEAVINTKGTLDISEAAGSIVHVGSTVNILGAGFAGNVQNLEIQIQSEAKQLGFVNSSADGSFEASLSIPEDLAAGTHNIVILYEGTEITRQQIEIGPKAADSFLQALTVGFTSDNKGLVPGVLILVGLLIVGVGSIGINALIPPQQSKR